MSQAVATPSIGLNPFLEGWLDRLGHDGPVLDLGCGHGFWTGHMAAAGMHVVGIEPEVHRVADDAALVTGDNAGHGVQATQAGHARHHRGDHADPGAPVMAGDGARLPVRDGSLALVWCIHVLHHLDDPVEVLDEIKRVLRPGGHLVLAETVEDNPVIRVARRVRPEWDGVPVRSRFTASTLLRLLDEAGLEVVERRQHSLVSFAAWTLPRAGRRAWLWLSGVEGHLPASWTTRWGAHMECVVRRP